MNKMNALIRGIVVFAILAVMTTVEYILGLIHAPGIVMWLIALGKAGLVLWYFMHLPRVFNPDEGEHHE
jgi:cytochrome c oxidase subunit 4